MILVVGSTGTLGGLITRRLLEQGREVRILVRPASDHAALVEAGAKPVVGDLKDPASVRRAVEGVDTVITTANSAQRGGEDNAETVDRDGNATLIDAARDAGVKQFIFTSAIGSTPDSPIPFVAAKGMSEQRLRASGMTFTILAPTPYMEVWLGMVVLGPMFEGREVTYVGDGTKRHSMVAIDDVASFAVAALDHPDARNAYLAIAGPTSFSWRDAVASVERATRRRLDQRGLPPGDPVPGLPDAVQGLVTLLGTTEIQLDASDTARRFGVRQTTLDEVVDRTLAGATVA
jgi:NADH dehydrogenase